MKKIALSVAQMNYLVDLGLDTSDASMIWEVSSSSQISFLNINYLKEEEKCIFLTSYAYTLQDILQKITNWSTHLLITLGYTDQGVNCTLLTENDNILNTTCSSPYNDEYDIDAVYKMLCWCIKNGYIKTNKEN